MKSIISIAQREADRAADQADPQDAAAIYFETVTETRKRGYSAEKILDAGLVSPNGAAGSYYVESQNGGGTYTVDLPGRSCTCPDHRHRGAYCKHLQAAELFAEAEELPDPFAPDYEALGNERITSQYRDSLDAAGMGLGSDRYGRRWTEDEVQAYVDYKRDV